MDTLWVLQSAARRGARYAVRALVRCVLFEMGQARLDDALEDAVPRACASGCAETLRTLLASASPERRTSLAGWVARATTAARDPELLLVALEFEPPEADLVWSACRALELGDRRVAEVLLSVAAGRD